MSESSNLPKGHVRRIVTGHDAQGRSCVTEDRPAPTVHTNPKRVGYVMTQLWITDDTPAAIDNGPDPTLRPVKLEPPPRGSVVRIIEFGPEGDWLRNIDASGTREAWGALSRPPRPPTPKARPGIPSCTAPRASTTRWFSRARSP